MEFDPACRVELSDNENLVVRDAALANGQALKTTYCGALVFLLERNADSGRAGSP